MRFAPPRPNPWRNFYHFTETDSTNEEAIRFIAKGVSSGIVVADRQTAGRGRGGKEWYSPRGKNLYVSFFGTTTSQQALDSAKAAGLAAFDTIVSFVPPHRTLLKWPNDILVDRRKLCGILIQHLTRGDSFFTVVGIGINVETPDKKAFPWRWEPTSLEEVTKRRISPSKVFRILVESLARWREASSSEITAAYENRIKWMHGTTIEWTTRGEQHYGTIVRFTEGGRLIVVRTKEESEEELAAGDIADILFP